MTKVVMITMTLLFMMFMMDMVKTEPLGWKPRKVWKLLEIEEPTTQIKNYLVENKKYLVDHGDQPGADSYTKGGYSPCTQGTGWDENKKYLVDHGDQPDADSYTKGGYSPCTQGTG